MSSPNPSEREPDSPQAPDVSKKRNPKEMAFIGVRIPKDVHQRLYRAKASLEFETGRFYGMGRLIERVIRRGLTQIERELDHTDDTTEEQ